MPCTPQKVPTFGMHCLVLLVFQSFSYTGSTLAFQTSAFHFQLCNVLRLFRIFNSRQRSIHLQHYKCNIKNYFSSLSLNVVTFQKNSYYHNPFLVKNLDTFIYIFSVEHDFPHNNNYISPPLAHTMLSLVQLTKWLLLLQ